MFRCYVPYHLRVHVHETFKVIKETVETRWPSIEFFESVLVILPVPAEFSEESKVILRICAYNAGLIKEKYSTNLQFTTERKNLNNLYKIIICFL